MPGEPFTSETTLAIMLGASRWPEYKKIDSEEAAKAFLKSAQDVAAYLKDAKLFNLPPDNFLNLFDDESSPNDINRRITSFLQTSQERASAAQRSIRDLLVYYIGHGGFTPGEQAYFLALRCTENESEGISSLRMSDLARTIRTRAKDLRRYFILDCCFAESAYDVLQDAGGSLASAAHTKSLLEFPGKGTALLCSSSARDFSKVPKGEDYTMFSGALLDVLRMGDVRLDKALSLEEVGRRVAGVINTKFPDKEVRPKVSSPDAREGDVADIPIFPNAALLARSTDERVSNLEEKLMQILEKLKTLDDLSARIPSLQQKIRSLEVGGNSPAEKEQKEGDSVSSSAMQARILKTAPPSVQVAAQVYKSALRVSSIWVALSIVICASSAATLLTFHRDQMDQFLWTRVLENPLHWIVLLLTAFSWCVLLLSRLTTIAFSGGIESDGIDVSGGEWKTLPIVLAMRSNRLVRIFGNMYVATPRFEVGGIVYTLTAIYLLATFIPAQMAAHQYFEPPGSPPIPAFSGTPGLSPSPAFSGTPGLSSPSPISSPPTPTSPPTAPPTPTPALPPPPTPRPTFRPQGEHGH